jgi:putative endonuclease
MKPGLNSPVYWLYFILCSGGGVYIGISKDVAARYEKHVARQGALYTKTHPPLRLLFSLSIGTRAEAMRLEKTLKKLKPIKKLEWAAANGWQIEG